MNQDQENYISFLTEIAKLMVKYNVQVTLVLCPWSSEVRNTTIIRKGYEEQALAFKNLSDLINQIVEEYEISMQ